MSKPSPLEARIDQLYQLPLEQFVPARNELARSAPRDEAARVRALGKPNVTAWALNQLYWHARATFDGVVEAAAQLRDAQADALRGKASDLRSADAEHRATLGVALKEASRQLEEAGHAVTPDTIRALTAALEAMPWTDTPGRLVRPPAARGFEAFAGMPMSVKPELARHTEPKKDALPKTESRKRELPRDTEPKKDAQAETGTPEPAHQRKTELTREERPAKAREEQVAKAEREERAAQERERAARLANARERVEEARREAQAAIEGARAAEARTAAAREAEQRARQQLDEARREVREAEAQRRELDRAQFAARTRLREAEEALSRLE